MQLFYILSNAQNIHKIENVLTTESKNKALMQPKFKPTFPPSHFSSERHLF